MNSINSDNDIIVAIASPYGRSAVAVIRVSGTGCIELVDRFLKHRLVANRMTYNVFDARDFSEKLMTVCFVAPHTYTGQDTVELYPHGNMTVCDGIIKTLIGAGARAAERGEFTKRAFLNGKLDLMQCEALADIIDAQTTEQLNYGNKRYDGGFKSLFEVEKSLKTALSTVEAILHYSDELEENEIDQAEMRDVYGAIDYAITALKKEIAGYAGGKIINDGFKVALIGAPNVGKSTLLNALTESDRAIVTPIAGTTRDIVDGEYVYNGRKFKVIDTAGITETADEVEKIGIERAYSAAATADAVLFLIANGQNPPKLDVQTAKTAVIENKCDAEQEVGTEYSKAQNGNILKISAKHGINITALKQKLYDMCPKDFGAICNHRQYDCIVRCLSYLTSAREESKNACGLEIVSALLYDAYSAIAELYGEQADENVISAVFERFCVGK